MWAKEKACLSERVFLRRRTAARGAKAGSMRKRGVVVLEPCTYPNTKPVPLAQCDILAALAGASDHRGVGMPNPTLPQVVREASEDRRIEESCVIRRPNGTPGPLLRALHVCLVRGAQKLPGALSAAPPSPCVAPPTWRLRPPPSFGHPKRQQRIAWSKPSSS